MGSANGRHSHKKGTKALPFQKVHCFVILFTPKGAYKLPLKLYISTLIIHIRPGGHAIIYLRGHIVVGGGGSSCDTQPQHALMFD